MAATAVHSLEAAPPGGRAGGGAKGKLRAASRLLKVRDLFGVEHRFSIARH